MEAMLRSLVFAMAIATASAFSMVMSDSPLQPSAKKIVPLVVKPRLKRSETPVTGKSRIVYEATFEHDRIVIRPKRRRVRRTFSQKLQLLLHRVQSLFQRIFSLL